MFRKIIALLMLGVTYLSFAAGTEGSEPLATIPFLDAPRYMGRWYEIAKYPNRFQKKCVGETRAEYSLRSDGNVQVINRCRMENGELNEAIGTARQIDGPSSPKLKVRFAPAWLSFIPAVWGDYWIIDLDADYQLAVISEPKREYLWVLSRSPTVRSDVYASLLERLRDKGFDTSRLEMTAQGVGSSGE